MQEIEPEAKEEPTALQKFMDGGLPQLLIGPAGKAISRLIGAAVDIPVARLEAKSQSIRQNQVAKDAVTNALATKISQIAPDNTEIIDRALTNMIEREYRVQSNKDAIAKVALEELGEVSLEPEADDVSEVWLSKFERYAEDASSADIQEMFGRILAGEITKPGSYSLATLHFVSMLDTSTSQLIDRILSHCSSEGLAFLECCDPKLSIIEIADLEQSGFWKTDLTYTLTFDERGIFISELDRRGVGVIIKAEPNQKINFKIAALSKPAKDLAQVVNRPFDFSAFARVAKASNVKSIDKGNTIISGTKIHISGATPI